MCILLRPFLLALFAALTFNFPLQAAPFTLTVTNGSQSGSYSQGATVNVWADPPGVGSVFDHWIGSGVAPVDANAAHTTLVMPATNATLQATYKPVDPWTPPRVVSYFPPTPSGVIFLFHGAGGRAASLFSDVEVGMLIQDAAARNFGVVALDSADEINKTWDVTNPAATNPDMQNVTQLRNYFISRQAISQTTPLYILGISQGGSFVSLLAQSAPALGFTVKAQAIYISAGDVTALSTTSVPTIWSLAQNDGLADGTSPNTRAISNYTNLINRGIATQIRTNIPMPLYPLRFWRIPGLTNVDSQNIFTALKNGGFLSSTNYLLQDPYTSNWSTVIPSVYAVYLGDIEDQLATTFTEHNFFSDFNNKVLNFFVNPTPIISVIPTISGFSPTSTAVGKTVTITGTQYAGITAVSFGGIAASSFTVDSDSRITATVPVGALSGMIKVTNSAGSATSSTRFTVALPPTITSFTPAQGPVGSVVTITGTNFTGATSVLFGGVAATSFTINSSTKITVTVPKGALTGLLKVITPGGTATSATRFTVG